MAFRFRKQGMLWASFAKFGGLSRSLFLLVLVFIVRIASYRHGKNPTKSRRGLRGGFQSERRVLNDPNWRGRVRRVKLIPTLARCLEASSSVGSEA